MADSPQIEDLRAEARYRRDRYDLYKAQVYGGRPTSPARLTELERAYDRAKARLIGPNKAARRTTATDGASPPGACGDRAHALGVVVNRSLQAGAGTPSARGATGVGLEPVGQGLGSLPGVVRGAGRLEHEQPPPPDRHAGKFSATGGVGRRQSSSETSRSPTPSGGTAKASTWLEDQVRGASESDWRAGQAASGLRLPGSADATTACGDRRGCDPRSPRRRELYRKLRPLAHRTSPRDLPEGGYTHDVGPGVRLSAGNAMNGIAFSSARPGRLTCLAYSKSSTRLKPSAPICWSVSPGLTARSRSSASVTVMSTRRRRSARRAEPRHAAPAPVAPQRVSASPT